MLSVVAIIPSPPALVPELAGAAGDELSDLRAAVWAAAAALPSHWIAVGGAETPYRVGPDAGGTFAGYGADVRVTLAPGPQELLDLPLCALAAAWVRGRAHPAARVETYCYPSSLDNASALEQGRRLRAEIDGQTQPVGLLVVADGCNTLTPAAPGGHDPDSVPVQAALDDALAAGDISAIGALPDGVVGRAAFALLAGLTEPGPSHTRELYRGAPYGVGYFVGVWRP